MNRLGIYIHWPYCISKCPYCDFNSHKIKNYDQSEWLSAYENQIKYFKEYLVSQNFKKIKLSSIFLGGGTPSLMPPKLTNCRFLFIALAMLVANEVLPTPGGPTKQRMVP